MNELAIFFQENMINIIFGIIGLIGTIIGIASLVSANNKNRQLAYLFKLADLNINKEVTEEKISQTKLNFEKITEKMQYAQEQMRREIPKAAKKAVLQDRLYAEMEQLTSIYNATINTKDKLKEIGGEINISPELLSHIQKEISPKYIIKEKQATYKTYITILTTAAAIASSIFPKPLNFLISIPVFSICAYFLLLLFIQSIELSRKSNNNERKNFHLEKYTLPLILGILSISFSLIIGINNFFFGYNSFNSIEENSGFFLMIVFFIIGIILFFWSYRELRILRKVRTQEIDLYNKNDFGKDKQNLK